MTGSRVRDRVVAALRPGSLRDQVQAARRLAAASFPHTAAQALRAALLPRPYRAPGPGQPCLSPPDPRAGWPGQAPHAISQVQLTGLFVRPSVTHGQ
jgi:hypothetical protein